MEASDTRAKRGIRVCLERRGFEILEEGWAHGGDVADLIARDEGDLVFVSCQVTQSGGEGFPEEDADRAALERLVAAYLAEHLGFEDVLVRFDVVSMLIVGESRALPSPITSCWLRCCVLCCPWPCCCDVFCAPCVAS